jgi:hypothetical protein
VRGPEPGHLHQPGFATLRPFSESMAGTRRVVGWTGVDVDRSPTHYAEVASDCLWWPAVGADE